MNNMALDFPCPVLTPIATDTERPSHSSLTVVKLELNANAASIATLLGDGVSGHLFLMLSLVDYFTQTGINFIAPTNPGMAPTHPVPPGSASEIAERVRLHKQDADNFRLYTRVDNALRNQIIAATPDIFIRAIRDPITGYGRISAMHMYTHLRTVYGRISQNEMTLNLSNMEKAWSPPTPLEAMFTQLADGCDFAAAGGEILPQTLVMRIGFGLIDRTGLYPEACRGWLMMPQGTHTSPLFKTHFEAAENYRLERERQTKANYANKMETYSTRTVPNVVIKDNDTSTTETTVTKT